MKMMSALKRSGLGRYERFCYRRARSRPIAQQDLGRQRCLLAGGQGLARAAGMLPELFPGAAETVICRADAICAHVFDLLGSGPTKLSPAGPAYQPLDWHTDFKSGYRWDPTELYRDIRYGHLKGVDVKVPWELSRFQHLNALGQAYLLTGDPKYPAEFTHQIEDWIRSNPPGFGVNWACTMDVAVRAANWLTAAEHFRAGEALSASFLPRFYSSLHEHAKFIRGHLERGSDGTTNHYLSDIVGLLYVAIYCPFFPESRRWRRFGIRELGRAMAGQVYADGGHFEASTCYHRLALELFFFGAWLVAAAERRPDRESLRQAAERIFGSQHMEKLRRMFCVVLHLLKPNGRMPQIGDNDSGRLHVFHGRDVLDMRYLLALGAVFFEEPQLKVKEFGFSEEALWVLGRRGYEVWEALNGRSVTTISSKAFPDAGWYVLRHGRDYCLISCGRNGANGQGGHAHNDKLSLELSLAGRDVIVDPGTCVYTSDPDRRNAFRSTGHHNTVAVDGYEQNELSPGALFHLPERVKIGRAELTETAERTRFEGEIEYAGVIHRRTVCTDQGSGRWRIEDFLRRSTPFDARVTFHLSPDVVSRGQGLFVKESGELLASLEIEGGSMEKGTYDYSPEYGVSVRAPCIWVHVPGRTGTASLTTVFTAHPAPVRTPAPQTAGPLEVTS